MQSFKDVEAALHPRSNPPLTHIDATDPDWRHIVESARHNGNARFVLDYNDALHGNHFNHRYISANLGILRLLYQWLDEDSRHALCRTLLYHLTLDLQYCTPARFPQYEEPHTAVKPGDVVLDLGAVHYENRAYAEAARMKHFVDFGTSFAELTERWGHDEKTCLHQFAAYSADGLINWRPNVNPECNLLPNAFGLEAERGLPVVPCRRLDSWLEETRIQLAVIKMDIEGSEYDALLGAQRYIRRNRPRLYVCLYHQPDDLWRIPMLLHTMRPDYQFWFENHGCCDPADLRVDRDETVLYCF